MVNVKKKKNDELDLDEEIVEDKEIIDDDLEESKPKKKVKDLEIDDGEDDDDDYHELTTEERLDNIEKKTNFILIITIIILLFCAVNTIVSFTNKSNNTKDDTTTTQDLANSFPYDTSAFKEIKAADIEKESKSETIIVWIGRQSCSSCQDYAPKIASIAKEYGVTVRYIDLGKIVDFSVEQPYVTDSNSWQILNNVSGSGEWESYVGKNIGSTPLTFVVNKNKVIGGHIGTSEDSATIEKLFTTAGFSK